MRVKHERGGDVGRVDALMREARLVGEHGYGHGREIKVILQLSQERGGDAGRRSALM